MPLVVTVNVLPTFRPTNWVLKVCGDRIYLMLRNYRNRHSPDDGPLVVCFQFNEIESVAKQEKQICVPGSYRWQKIYWTERHLEIRLKAPVPEALRRVLEAEAARKPPYEGYSRSKRYHPSSVSVDDRTIRILWNGRHDVVKPSIDKVLDLLGHNVSQNSAVQFDRQPEELDDDEFDDFILGLCQSGNRMEAINLLRHQRGYSLTDAKRFADELASS